MRVLQLVASGDIGGGTNHVWQILRGLREVCSLSLITQSESFLYRKAVESGLPCIGVDFFSGRLDPRVPVRLRRALAELKPQVVHVHGGRAAFFWALAGSALPSIYTVHGFHFVHKPALIRLFAIAAERLALRRASHVVFVSRYDQELALTSRLIPTWKSSSLIHNGIPCLRQEAPAQPGAGLIGFVGRLEVQKDPLLFLACMQELPEYRAVIIGAGASEEEVRREIERLGLSGRVTMRGALSHEATMNAMRELQVLVMTSRWEGLPLIALEAMWRGIPVVATDVGGMSEIIESGRSGILVQERTALALAAAVRGVSEDSSLRAELVQEASGRVERLFSEQAMLSRLRTLYEEFADPGEAFEIDRTCS